jgi:pyruvate dehydrogenase E2 component (dihydrolipoamide acetyltransferase)
MLRDVALPKLGQTMEEATIQTWHRKEGDAIQKGDILLEINTDKAALEVESFYSGVVKKLLYPEGTTLPVNAIIAFIGDPGDVVTEEAIRNALATGVKAATVGAAPAAAPKPQGVAVAERAVQAAAPIEAAAAPSGRLFASPRARRTATERKVPLRLLRGSGPGGRVVERDVLAHAERVSRLRVSPTALEVAFQRGVDLTRVKGSGIDGRIMKEDIEAAPTGPTAPGLPSGPRVALTPMRRIVAQRMAHSKSTIPHFYLTMDVDMTEAVSYRRTLAETQGRKVSFNDLILRACTIAFAKVPEMNVAWADGSLIEREEVNIGLAVALDTGLIVPVVRRCESKGLEQVAEATAALIEKARNKRLTPDEYEGGCLTVSNLGMFGVETVVPIINPGEVAILGVGRIAARPIVIGSAIVIRQMTTLVIACDHRLVDGAIGGRFLRAIKDALEAPQTLA